MLPEVAGVNAVNAISEALLGHIKSKAKKPVIIDASAVESITTPCIQLLLSASKSLEAKKRQLHIINPTQPLEEACSMLGLHKEYNQWSSSHD